jgi:hypothetical protein
MTKEFRRIVHREFRRSRRTNGVGFNREMAAITIQSIVLTSLIS